MTEPRPRWRIDVEALPDHELAGLLRDYRAATKLLGTYGEKWLEHVEGGGRVYADWKQTGSEAGRMSMPGDRRGRDQARPRPAVGAQGRTPRRLPRPRRPRRDRRRVR